MNIWLEIFKSMSREEVNSETVVEIGMKLNQSVLNCRCFFDHSSNQVGLSCELPPNLLGYHKVVFHASIDQLIVFGYGDGSFLMVKKEQNSSSWVVSAGFLLVLTNTFDCIVAASAIFFKKVFTALPFICVKVPVCALVRISPWLLTRVGIREAAAVRSTAAISSLVNSEFHALSTIRFTNSGTLFTIAAHKASFAVSGCIDDLTENERPL